jgi:hypothetical protein
MGIRPSAMAPSCNERVHARREAHASRPASREARQVGTAYLEEHIHALDAPGTAAWASGAIASAGRGCGGCECEQAPSYSASPGLRDPRRLLFEVKPEHEARGTATRLRGKRQKRREDTVGDVRRVQRSWTAGPECALFFLSLLARTVFSSSTRWLTFHRFNSSQWSCSSSSTSRLCLWTCARA